MKLFLVDAVSSFRNSYVIRCKDETHAADTVTLQEADEVSQEWLGESISRISEITEEQYLKMFDKDNDYLKLWSDEKKMSLIHTVDYEKETPFNPIANGCLKI